MTAKNTLFAVLVMVATAGTALADTISEQTVIDPQTAWGEGIVAISKTH